jgi:dGTPase
VRDGIRAHSWRIDPPPATPEAFCVRYADRIAYLSHDALDAIRAGVLTPDSIPPRVRERFGEPGRVWIGEMIEAVIDNSLAVGEVRMDAETLEVMNDLREFMFERVYFAPALVHEQRAAIGLIRDLVDHHLAHPDQIPASYREDDAPIVTQVADYVAGMTDRFALAVHESMPGGRSQA